MEPQKYEDRIRELEAEVAALKERLKGAPSGNWVERMDGMFADEPAFDDVIRYGREFRESVPPPTEEEA